MSGYAWGPDRETFQNGGQATYVSLNSVVDAVGIGDERNFVRVREAGSSYTRGDYAALAAGKRYEIYVYYRNNSSVAAQGLKVGSYFSRYVDAEHSGIAMGEIAADNANPGVVWDGVNLLPTGEGVLELSYVDGSAEVHSAGAANGARLTGILDGGAMLGYNALDGVLSGGAEYAGYVTYEIEASTVSGAVNFEEMVGVSMVKEVTGGSGGTEEVIGTSSEDIPTTGGTMMPVFLALGMGILVTLGWSLLIKLRKRDKIESSN